MTEIMIAILIIFVIADIIVTLKRCNEIDEQQAHIKKAI